MDIIGITHIDDLIYKHLHNSYMKEVLYELQELHLQREMFSYFTVNLFLDLIDYNEEFYIFN